MCEKGLRKKKNSPAVCLSPSAGSKPAMNRGGEMNKIMFTPHYSPHCPPGWVQARCRHFRGRPEERSAHPPCFSHSGHRLQQAGQCPEAENLRLEGVSAAGPVSTLFSVSHSKWYTALKLHSFIHVEIYYCCCCLLICHFTALPKYIKTIRLNCNSC